MAEFGREDGGRWNSAAHSGQVLGFRSGSGNDLPLHSENAQEGAVAALKE